jgi:Tfp pilus assembly protein PilE
MIPTDPQKNPGAGFGVASIVLGAFPLLNLAGIALGIVSIVKSKKANKPVTLGVVGLVISVVMIFVMFILGVMVAVTYQGVQVRSKEYAAKTNENYVSSRAEAYYAINGTYPLNADEMKQAILDVSPDDARVIDLVDGKPNNTDELGYMFCAPDAAQVIRRDIRTNATIIRAIGMASEAELCN